MIKLFNGGQIHHFAQLRDKNEGYISDDLIERFKKEIPSDMLNVIRMSGTMSNQWALDLPGFNHPRHDLQIEGNKTVPQPRQSYIYAFVDFYKKMGFKELIWTINTISPWTKPQERDIWEKRMWDALEYVMKNCNVTRICLENEMWMYGDCVGLDNGTINLASVIRYKNIFPNQIQNLARRDLNNFLKYLENIAKQIKQKYPKIKLGISIDSNTHLRGRMITEELKKFNFYDAVCPHIYITPVNKSQTESMVKARIDHAKTFKKEIWVTEFNWAYGDNDEGVDWGKYHDNFFREDIINALEKNGVTLAAFHTIWAGRSSYGWLQN